MQEHLRREVLSILAEIIVPEELFKVGIWDVSGFLNCLTVFQNSLPHFSNLTVQAFFLCFPQHSDYLVLFFFRYWRSELEFLELSALL